MEIRIQAVKFDAADKLLEFVNKKVSKLEKYSDEIMDADVILKVIKPETAKNKQAAIKLKVRSAELFAENSADTFEEAIDLDAEALKKQLIKRKEKKYDI